MLKSFRCTIAAVVAVAVHSLGVVSADPPKKASAETIAKVIEANKEADEKLKHSYQKLVSVYKQGNALTADLAAANATLLNPRVVNPVRGQLKAQARKLEAEIATRKAEVKPLENHYTRNKQAVLASLNRSCASVLKEAVDGLDATTLEAVATLFDLFVVVEQTELPDLMIGASFIDQDVWKEASDCMARHGIACLPGLKKILLSKNIAAKYAAAAAFTKIGQKATQADRGVYSEVVVMNTALNKAKLDQNEKRVRQKILDDAMDALRPVSTEKK